MKSELTQTVVLVTGGATANSLGVIRSFGRRGIPVVYLDSKPYNMVRYSRYISKRLSCPDPVESESGFIGALANYGSQSGLKLFIVPTTDSAVLALSKHIHQLDPFYHLPVPPFEEVNKLVNKKAFYKMLAEMNVPHPRTHFPESLAELKSMGHEIDFPFIIKPVYSSAFQDVFHQKCFVIKSVKELDRTAHRLNGRNIDVLIQEIIPGRRVFTFMTYLNKASEPLGICGWEKIRNYPPDFGNGTLCESTWRPSAIELGIKFLQAIRYHGFAAPELKIDPRDGEYKMLEVNARTDLANPLTDACGIDIKYLAYLDAMGYPVTEAPFPRAGVIWIDDYIDLLSCLIHLKRRKLGISDVYKTLKPGKVHSVLAWDDPSPFIVSGIYLSVRALRLALRK